jgi:hypothetical protein
MAWLRDFDLTVQLMSGASITCSVKKSHYIGWVIGRVDREFDLRSTKYHLVHNDRLLIFHDDSTLQDLGIDGPTTLTVVIEGPCPTRRLPVWERYWDLKRSR